MIYGHGDDLYCYGGSVRVNFSSNIYTAADLSALKRHLAERLDMVRRYPEPRPLSLESAIADAEGLSPECVMVTNGATESIYIIARALCSDFGAEGFTHVIKQPTFSEYADACRLNGAVITHCGDSVEGRKAYWLCNPNNPTGFVTGRTDMLNAIDSHADDIFIIDQSYEDYTSCQLLNDADAVQRHNILLLHSMTKRYCVPGLRLGYVVANADLTNRLRRYCHPWSVNTLAIEAGLFLTRHTPYALTARDALLKESAWLRQELSSIDGVTVWPSSTNFMLCRLDTGSAAGLKAFLVDEHGLLIRDASNFDTLDSRFFRVAAQTHADNSELVSAVREYKMRYK